MNDATNWGGTGPTNVADLTDNADWQLPDTLAGGASYNVNLTAGTGPWFVGGDSGGGITFLGGETPTAYTVTAGDSSAILNVAGVINYSSTTNRGIVTNNSPVQQVFDLDILNWQSLYDAKDGNIEFKAGRNFATGGGPDGIGSNSIRNQHTAQFQGDKSIFFNATATATTSSSSNRGALVYLGADTTPTADTMLVLGDIVLDSWPRSWLRQTTAVWCGLRTTIHLVETMAPLAAPSEERKSVPGMALPTARWNWTAPLAI